MDLSSDNSARAVQRNLNVLLLILASAILIYSFFGELARRFTLRTIDFEHFYFAALAIVNHTDIYQSWIGGYIYPPFFAFLLIPLTRFPYMTSVVIWAVINIFLLVASLGLAFKTIARHFKIEFTPWQLVGVCSLAIALSYDQVRWELLTGQSDTVTLLGITLALYWIERKPYIAGALLGATINIKYQALCFLPLLILRGRWQTLLGLLGGTAFFAFLPALAIGWKTNLNYLAVALRGLFNMVNPEVLALGVAAKVPKIGWHLNITITNGIYRLFTAHGLSNFDVAIAVLALMAMTGCIFIFLFRNYNKESAAVFYLEGCALLGCMLIFSPQNMMRHLYLLLTIQLLAAIFLMFPKPGVKRWPLLLAVIVSQVGLHMPHEGYAFWFFIGGPCWSLLPFMIILIHTGLSYCRGLLFTRDGHLINQNRSRANTTPAVGIISDR